MIVVDREEDYDRERNSLFRVHRYFVAACSLSLSWLFAETEAWLFVESCFRDEREMPSGRGSIFGRPNRCIAAGYGRTVHSTVRLRTYQVRRQQRQPPAKSVRSFSDVELWTQTQTMC